MYDIKAEVLEIENLSEDYYSIKLKPLEKFTWKAGQFIILKMLEGNTNAENKRTLSIASCEDEKIILLGTRIGKNISSFKEKLINKKPGDIVYIQGPMGKFVKQDETSPMVFIIGGIGITPARAIIKSLENEKNIKVEIVYSARVYHMFLEELKSIAKNNASISIYTTKSREETDVELNKLIPKYKESAYFYISGTEGMVKGIKDMLFENGINKNKIISDMMIGY